MQVEKGKIASKYSIYLFCTAVVGFVLLLLLPESLFSIALGKGWVDIAHYLPQLAIAFVFIFMNPPLLAYFVSKGDFYIIVKCQFIEIFAKGFFVMGYLFLFQDDYSFIILSMVSSIILYNILLLRKTVTDKGR